MPQITKILNKKLPPIFYLPIIFVFFCLFLFTVLYPKFFVSDNLNYQHKIPQKEINKISSPSTTKKEASFYNPPSSGNSLKVPILFYHYVGNNPNPKDLQRDVLSISPDKFEEQIKYLKENGFTAISLDTLYAALKKQTTIADKSVVLTFDDGYIDFYYNAYPILLKYHLSAMVFIPTGLVGGSYYLTWPQIKEMQSSGLINYGSHSVHHYNLPSISENSAYQELSESKKTLQDNLGVPINFISYPNGAVNNFIINLAQKAGYVGGVGTWANTTQSEGTIYDMPRLRISGSINLTNFVNLLR